MRNRLIQILLALIAGRAMGQTFIYDQQSVPIDPPDGGEFVGAGGGIEPGFGQSFVPTLSSVGFIRLEFINVAVPGASNATVDVNLWAGGIETGTLLGTSTPIFLPVGTSTWTNVFFTTPVAVQPGTRYFFEPLIISGGGATGVNDVQMLLTDPRQAGGNAYPDGSLFYFDTPVSPGFDYYFREGIVVPEPTSISLALCAAVGLLFRR